MWCSGREAASLWPPFSNPSSMHTHTYRHTCVGAPNLSWPGHLLGERKHSLWVHQPKNQPPHVVAPLGKPWCWGERWNSPGTPSLTWYSCGAGTWRWNTLCSLSFSSAPPKQAYFGRLRDNLIYLRWIISIYPSFKDPCSYFTGARGEEMHGWDLYKCPWQTAGWFQGQLLT